MYNSKLGRICDATCCDGLDALGVSGVKKMLIKYFRYYSNLQPTVSLSLTTFVL